jgi:hypothetical protein
MNRMYFLRAIVLRAAHCAAALFADSPTAPGILQAVSALYRGDSN